jgi:hypothetical protein
LILKRSEPPARAWCAECAAGVELVTPEEAALLTGSSQRAICRQVEAGRLHFSETADGRLFVCLNSLHTGRRNRPPDQAHQQSPDGEPE